MKTKNLICSVFVLLSVVACQSTDKLGVEQLAGQNGQEWKVVKIGEMAISPSSETPYIGFKTNGQIWGFTGCNRLTGEYSIKKNGEIDLSRVGSTMMLCPEDKYEAPFMAELAKVKIVKMKDENNLSLLDENKKEVVALWSNKKMTAEYLNGKWVLLSGRNISSLESVEEKPFLDFDIKEKKVSGFTGCNRIFGPFNVKTFLDGKVNFENMGMTRMLCHDNGLERNFMDNFNLATQVKFQENVLILLSRQNEELLRFKKEE